MLFLVGEAYNLVLDGWAIPRSDTFDDPSIQGGEMNVLSDERGRLFGRSGDETV